MDFKVNVIFDVAPTLAELLGALVRALQAAPTKQAPASAPAPELPSTQPQMAAPPTPVNTPTPPTPPTPPKTPAAPEAAPAPLPQKPTPEQENLMTIQPTSTTELTDGDLRQAMDLVYIRLEGEDYKDRIGTDPKQLAVHKAINRTFKQISQTLGSTRPGDLPVDKRPAFVAACREIFLNADGMPDCKAPF